MQKQSQTRLLPVVRQVFSHFPESRATSAYYRANSYLGRLVTPNTYPLLAPSPTFIWDISMVSWGQLSWLCPLLAPCATQAHLLLGDVRSRKNLDSV